MKKIVDTIKDIAEMLFIWFIVFPIFCIVWTFFDKDNDNEGGW